MGYTLEDHIRLNVDNLKEAGLIKASNIDRVVEVLEMRLKGHYESGRDVLKRITNDLTTLEKGLKEGLKNGAKTPSLDEIISVEYFSEYEMQDKIFSVTVSFNVLGPEKEKVLKLVAMVDKLQYEYGDCLVEKDSLKINSFEEITLGSENKKKVQGIKLR